MTELRGLLEAEQRRILGKAHAARAFSRDRDRNRVGGDSVDDAAGESMYGTELGLADRENFLLNKVERALTRLADNTIDQCEDCDEEIGFPRLRARPATTLCILCQEDHESLGE